MFESSQILKISSGVELKKKLPIKIVGFCFQRH